MSRSLPLEVRLPPLGQETLNSSARLPENIRMVFSRPSRIRVVDTDVSTRIHYSALFRHVEAAETEFLRSLGLEYSRWFEMGYSLPRVRVEADYLAPLCFDDEVVTEISVERLGDTSVTFAFRMLKAHTGEVGAQGRLVCVCMDIQTGRSASIPGSIRQAFERAQSA
jgi:YbgC/YbaW family acyl-CoA thioester hydrolase